jgi:hypothetical protein
MNYDSVKSVIEKFRYLYTRNSLISQAVSTSFSLETFDSFFRYDWDHDEGGYRVGPPQTENRIE